MEFTLLLMAITAILVAAWQGSRALTLTLFALTLVASVATYLHHATDKLNLSF
jgi:hypothetical protein